MSTTRSGNEKFYSELCIGTINQNTKRQCSRKGKKEYGNLCGLHYNKQLKHGVIDTIVNVTKKTTKSFVKKIISFEVPSSTDFNFTNNRAKIFNPNLYININSTIEDKIKLLKIYKKEIKKWPHSRSLKSIKNLAMYRGSQVGIKFAEAFTLIRELQN